jgi:glycosyltransferase involved in cell wall biosynthesis
VSAPRCAFAVPGDLATPTGGYLYDRRLLAGLRRLGHDVTHLALGASFPDPTPADTADAAARLAAVPADCPVIVDGLALGAMDPAVLAGTAAPIVALVHHPLALESGLAPARRAQLARSERQNLAGVAHVVVPSAHTARLLATDYGVAPARITVARPGVDRSPVRGPKADPPLVLSVGILVPRKGHDVLLRALARIRDRRWQAVIVGAALDAAHAASLERLRSELALTDRVRLAGTVDADTLARCYGQARLFALATRHEGHGIVFDEAMAHGLPIVACATGAVPDTVAPGAGLLVPPEDPEALAAALARVLDEPATHAALAAASAAAGAALPAWEETARLVAGVLARLSGREPEP